MALRRILRVASLLLVLPALGAGRERLDPPAMEGTAWGPAGRVSAKLRGTGRARERGGLLVLFGPLGFADDEGTIVDTIPAGRFVIRDDRDRSLAGDYAADGAGGIALSFDPGRLELFIESLLEAGPRVPSVDGVTVLSAEAAGTARRAPARATHRGDRLRLRVDARFTEEAGAGEGLAGAFRLRARGAALQIEPPPGG